MIFLYVIAALSALLTFAFGMLPDGGFLPLPTAAYGAVNYFGGVVGWGLGLAGDEIKAALLVSIPIIIGVNVTLFLWDIVRKWRPPVVGKIL